VGWPTWTPSSARWRGEDRVSMHISQDQFTYSELGSLSWEILPEVQRLLESSKENFS